MTLYIVHHTTIERYIDARIYSVEINIYGDLSEESPVEGPSEPITLEMITKAITKMASGKAAGPSGIVAEMLKPVGEAGAEEVRDLVENIISEGCIPTDWQESFIVNLYKGKGDALNRGNYRGLKLIEQVMKVLERVVEGLIRQRVEIDEMQFYLFYLNNILRGWHN